MKYLIGVLLTLTLSAGVLSALSTTMNFQERDKRLLNLQKEKDKLKSQTDPVSYTKTQIKISEILLTLVTDAVRSGDTEMMEQRLSEYVSAVSEAHQKMVKTGRDAHKKPNGFRHLEIALRRQVSQLKEISGGLNFDERDPVEKARDKVIGIRDDLLKAIFGSPNGTSDRS